MNMFRQIAAVALKEFKILFKDLEALALLFAMPVFFILVMSFALEGVFEAGSEDHPIEILLVNMDKGPMAGQISEDMATLKGLKLVRESDGKVMVRQRAELLVKEKSSPMALLFENDFSESLKRFVASPEADLPRITLIIDPATNRQLLAPVKAAIGALVERRVAIARQIYQIKKSFSYLGEGSDVVLSSRKALSGPYSPAVNLEILAPEGTSGNIRPSATEQNVPGYTIFGVFFIVLPLAAGFMREKHDGTFQRILAAPISKWTLLVGKLLPYYLVNIIQIGLMFAVGAIVFEIHFGTIYGLIPISLALAACANGLGLMVAALGKTEAQVGALGVFFAVVLSALGGIMVPTFVMPDVMKILSQLTPHAWALSGYHDVMLRGLGFGGVWQETTVLLGFAGLFFLIALWRFRFTS
jgi:linearmycin/streptolysin S transport system permease protein